MEVLKVWNYRKYGNIEMVELSEVWNYRNYGIIEIMELLKLWNCLIGLIIQNIEMPIFELLQRVFNL